MAEVAEVVVTDEETRDVLEAAIWRHLHELISENFVGSKFADEAYECSEHTLGGAKDAGSFGAFGAHLEEVTDSWAAIDTLRGCLPGDAFTPPIATSSLAELVRRIMIGISDDEAFWDRPDRRQRMMAMYEAAERLMDELAVPAVA